MLEVTIEKQCMEHGGANREAESGVTRLGRLLWDSRYARALSDTRRMDKTATASVLLKAMEEDQDKT
jgi:hypothetical protein